MKYEEYSTSKSSSLITHNVKQSSFTANNNKNPYVSP